MTTREKIKRLEELLRCDDDDDGDRKRVEIVDTLEDLAKCVKETEDFEGIVETSERTFRVFEEDLGVLTSCCRVIRNACARSNQVRNDVGKTKLLSCLIRTIRLALRRRENVSLLVSIQTLGNCITKSSRDFIWNAMFRLSEKEEKILFCELCCSDCMNNKALTRLSMILFLCIRDEESHMKAFVTNRKLIHTWLRVFRSDDTNKDIADTVEWVLFTVQEMISSESVISTLILQIESDTDDLALFLNLVLVAMCHDDDDDENDVKTKGLHSKDAHTVAKLVLTLLQRLDEDNKALHSASAAALEICADLSSKMRSTFESCHNAAAVRVRDVRTREFQTFHFLSLSRDNYLDQKNVACMTHSCLWKITQTAKTKLALRARTQVRETLLNADDDAVQILVRKILEPLSPGRRKAGLSKTTTTIHPGICDQLLNNSMRLLANCSFHNKAWQNRVREVNGIEAILSCTTINEKNPILREWALLAVRNLCDGNVANQRRIEELKPRKVLQDPTLKKAGYQIRFDEASGKPKIETADEDD